MPKKKLRVIPQPPDGTRAVLSRSDGDATPFYVGKGSYDLVCGSCGHKLAKSLLADQVRGTVFRCSMCGAFNDTEPAAPAPN